jgi:hypothetical protein
MEVKTPDGMFSVDIVVPWRGCLVAVEVNGPQHYTKVLSKQRSSASAHAHSVSNTPPLLPGNEVRPAHPSPGQGTRVEEGGSNSMLQERAFELCQQHLRPTGYKILRDRFLHQRGYSVANVSWLEWEHASRGGSKSAKKFLEGLLNQAWKSKHTKL